MLLLVDGECIVRDILIMRLPVCICKKLKLIGYTVIYIISAKY